jgi:hypothetical protein
MAAMIFTATAGVLENFTRFDESDRIEHYRHMAAVAKTASEELAAQINAPVLPDDYDYRGEVNGTKAATWSCRRILMQAIALLCVPDLAFGQGLTLTKDALAGYFHSTDVLSEKEQLDIWLMFEALDDAEYLIPDEEEEEEEDDGEETVPFWVGMTALVPPLRPRQTTALVFEPPTAPYDCPICYEEKDCECWTCPTCHTHVCHECMDHWITTDIAFHVDEDFEWNTHEQHATCPYCRASIPA